MWRAEKNTIALIGDLMLVERLDEHRVDRWADFQTTVDVLR